MGSNEPDPIHSNPCVLPVLTVYYFTVTADIYCSQVVFSRGDDESNRVIGMSPRNRNVSYQPQQLVFIWIEVMGQFWLVLSSDV